MFGKAAPTGLERGGPKKVGYVFGIGLNELLGRERTRVPRLLTSLLGFLEDSEGVLTRDIFRAEPGSQAEVEDLMVAFDSGRPFDVSAKCWDPLVAARVLKNFLLALPSPLIPTMASSELDAALGAEDCVRSLGNALKSLSSAAKSFLSTLLLFLHRVAAHGEENNMAAPDLGAVFGPLLMMGRDAVTTRVVTALIAQAPEIIDVVTESQLQVLLQGSRRMNDLQLLFQEKWSRRARRALRREAKDRKGRNLVPRLRAKVDALTRERNELKHALESSSHARMHDIEDLELQVRAGDSKLASANARIGTMEETIADLRSALASAEERAEQNASSSSSASKKDSPRPPSARGGAGNDKSAHEPDHSSPGSRVNHLALVGQLENARLEVATLRSSLEQTQREHALLTRAKHDLTLANDKLKSELQDVKIAKSSLALQRRQLEFQVTKLNHFVKESGGEPLSLEMLLAAAAGGPGEGGGPSSSSSAGPVGSPISAARRGSTASVMSNNETSGRLRVASSVDDELRVLRSALSQEQGAHAKAKHRISLLHKEIKSLSAQIVGLRRKLNSRASHGRTSGGPSFNGASSRDTLAVARSATAAANTHDELSVRHLQSMLEEVRADNARLTKVCVANNEKIHEILSLNKRLKKKCVSLLKTSAASPDERSEAG